MSDESLARPVLDRRLMDWLWSVVRWPLALAAVLGVGMGLVWVGAHLLLR